MRAWYSPTYHYGFIDIKRFSELQRNHIFQRGLNELTAGIKMVNVNGNGFRYYRALESVSIASALSTAGT